MNASIWQGPSGPLIGHISLGVLSKLKPRASSALVETVYGMDEGTIGPLWARNTPSDNEIRTAHGRICIFILLEADRTSIPSIVSHGRTMNVVVVDIPPSRKVAPKRRPRRISPVKSRPRHLAGSSPARGWERTRERFLNGQSCPYFKRKLLCTAVTLESAMAAEASMGESRPSAATGMPTRSEEHTSEL